MDTRNEEPVPVYIQKVIQILLPSFHNHAQDLYEFLLPWPFNHFLMLLPFVLPTLSFVSDIFIPDFATIVTPYIHFLHAHGLLSLLTAFH